MATGADRADAAYGAPAELNADWLGAPPEETAGEAAPEAAPRDSQGGGRKALAALLIFLALAWIGAAGWAMWEARLSLTLPGAVSWIATLSAPLVLLGLVWLWLGRTPRREAERFTLAVEAMRAESVALESVLQIVATRIEENHARLRGEAERLMTLGDEAADRLGRVTHYLSKERSGLDTQAAALESAAAAAKVDVGVLLHDLPRAEEQARAVAAAMKDAGITAHSQAGALEAQLSALLAKAREADEQLGGAAQRMGAHVARIESTSASAAASMGEASAGMTAAVDAAMERATEGLEAARSGLAAQAEAMLAAIEQSRAALDRAGEDAARNLGQRLEAISGQIHALAGHLSAQDAASHALVTGLGKELAELDQWFEQLGRTGGAETERLSGSVQAVRESTRELIAELGGGTEQAGTLIGRAREMADVLSATAEQLRDDLPDALLKVEEQAGRTHAAAASVQPLVESIQASSEQAGARIGEAEAAIARQREALDSLLARIEEGTSGAEEQLARLGTAAAEARENAAKIVSDTGPELIDALLRVRDAANQASERAREAIGAAIPESAANLGDAARNALETALAETFERQMGELAALSERAVGTARQASERLTRQMLALGETAAAVEARIDEARREREEKESENFSRRVALLIESLNSTAIDVTKILSNEVTDSAWSAYLKGDRGVFTRRAVRLLDTAEAREIVRHYEEEPEFREQVNRYIHDFEAMLRRILADRDGHPLGVTILSSDMGKLYVALAQAIERLRK